MRGRRWGWIAGLLVAVVALVAVGILVGTREEEPTALKPVVYLYPERTTTVTVGLTAHGSVLRVPGAAGRPVAGRRGAGWHPDRRARTAVPVPVLGGPLPRWCRDMSTGSVVRAEAVVPFLERTLAELGLTDREAAEFITFWAPD